MKKITVLIVMAFTAICFGFTVSDNDTANYWQQRADYVMDISLDPDSSLVTGKSVITYINQSPYELDRIYMNLYHKAFNRNSVKAREYLHTEKSWRANYVRNKNNDSWVHDYHITDFSLTMPDGETITTYKIDDTILESVLPKALNPGESLTINISWDHKVGSMFERSGREGDQFNMAHWYPRTAVFDKKGWHADPFHAEGEFYGDFGNFTVSLEMPSNYIAGASGVVTSGDPGWDIVKVDTSIALDENLKRIDEAKNNVSVDLRKVTFFAENVHDFAWVASPDYLYESGEWNGIDLHILYNRKNASKWYKEVLKRTSRVTEWLSTNFGAYPYPQVTTSDRLRSGGMEYPMLVMNGSDSESLISHEIGHIWYYGILANNEVNSAWMDEGFTSFQEDWYMTHYYETGFPPRKPKNFVERNLPKRYLEDSNYWSTIIYQTSNFDEPVQRKSHHYKSSNGYRLNVYTKSSAMMKELRLLLGDSLMLKGMQEYFDRWNLKHVNEKRFTSTMSEVAGQDLSWFFDSWLNDTRVLDYSLDKWTKGKNQDGSWDLTIKIGMKGNRYYPVPIGIYFKDGSSETVKYEDFLWKFDNSYTVKVAQEPVKVVLDPESRTMDVDFRNNYLRSMPYSVHFNWPGSRYIPRDKFIVKWNPQLDYHENDGFIPGFVLSRNYYNWEVKSIYLGYAIESGNIYGGYSGWTKPVHFMSGTTWNYGISNVGGVTSGSLSLKYTYRNNSIKLMDPTFTTGIYFTNAHDTSLTDLYDPGVVSVLYEKISFNTFLGNTGLELASAPLGLSDWGFARFTLTHTNSGKMGMVKYRSRTIIGKMWYDSNLGLPGQEKYTVEGAGSGDLFSKPYLRDESSFYGWTESRSTYHLPGDGNLRGFVGDGYSGAHQLATANVETYFNKRILGTNLELAAFADGGLIWNDEFDGDLLFDAGVGIRLDKNILSKNFYLRFDVPFIKSVPGQDLELDFSNIVFSLSKSI